MPLAVCTPLLHPLVSVTQDVGAAGSAEAPISNKEANRDPADPLDVPDFGEVNNEAAAAGATAKTSNRSKRRTNEESLLGGVLQSRATR